MENACQIIINDILNGKITTRRELEVEKRQLCRDLKLSKFMSNADILEFAKSYIAKAEWARGDRVLLYSDKL